MMAATAPTPSPLFPHSLAGTPACSRKYAAKGAEPCCSLGEADVNHIDAKAQGPRFTIQRAGVPQGLSLGDLAQDQWQR